MPATQANATAAPNSTGSAERALDLPGAGGQGVESLGRVLDLLCRLPRPVAGALFAGLALFIGWMDMLSGIEVSIFVFYAIPIALTVAVLGIRWGIASAALAAFVWWFANRNFSMYETQVGYLLATVNRLFYFGVVVVAVAAVIKRQQSDAARIRALEERRQLERELVRATEREQQRIGQDLHDGLCQRLAAIACAARMLADDLQERSQDESQDASLIESAIQDAVVEARNLARGIFPAHLDGESISVALTDLAETMHRLTGTRFIVDFPADVAFPPKTAMHLYRIAQEAVANAVRHSDATEITLSLQVQPRTRQLEFRVEDNGKGAGLPQEREGKGMGLRTMRYRAEALGGHLDIGARQGGGTVVTCRIALPEAGAEPRGQA